VAAYRGLGARACEIIYNGIDPEISHPVAPDPRFRGDLGFLGNRLPDREQRVDLFFLQPARQAQSMTFLLGGSGWDTADLPGNVLRLGHVGTADNNAFNSTVRAVLNVNRQSMAEYGFAPPTRVFEAAGAGACTITDSWNGIEAFLTPGEEILVARDGQDVLEALAGLDESAAKAIGTRARLRMLSEHTYDKRAESADWLFRKMLAAKNMTIPS
jgi:spore maturation protein CgeB